MMNMVKHWHRWPIETVDALSLEPFNIKLENSVADIPPLIAGGLDKRIFKGPFQLQLLYDSMIFKGKKYLSGSKYNKASWLKNQGDVQW